uniref:Putative secreted protein n=1 Tax=Anopheles triannulatus TaxID=58253 RepID=A0A2M4B457_9DIPT
MFPLLKLSSFTHRLYVTLLATFMTRLQSKRTVPLPMRCATSPTRILRLRFLFITLLGRCLSLFELAFLLAHC